MNGDDLNGSVSSGGSVESEASSSNTKLIANRYELRSFIGAGANGAVCGVWDTKLKRNVALKLPTLYEGESLEEANARMQQEAEMSSGLQHPNIVRVLDCGFVGEGDSHLGEFFVVMDFIEGESLSKYVRTHSMDMPRIVDIAKQIADALAYIHSRTPSVVHRDIRGDNILITKEGHIYLLDWGVSTWSGTMATAQFRKGTVWFMAPEVIEEELAKTPDGKKKIDGRADLYSLGVLLYLFVTGKLPVSGLTIEEQAELLKTKAIEPCGKMNPTCPAELERMIQRLLAYRRDDRYPGAKELYDDLKVLAKTMEKPVAIGELEKRPEIPLPEGIHVGPSKKEKHVPAQKESEPGPIEDETDYGPQAIRPRMSKSMAIGLSAIGGIVGFWLLFGSGSSPKETHAETAQAEPGAFVANAAPQLTPTSIPSRPEELERLIMEDSSPTVRVPQAAEEAKRATRSAVQHRKSANARAVSRAVYNQPGSTSSGKAESLGDDLVVYDREKGTGNSNTYGVVLGTTFPALLMHKIVTTNIASPVRADLAIDFQSKGSTVFPRGSRFIGRAVSGAGDRIQIRFDRIVLPNSQEVSFSGAALDTAGALGIAGMVDRRRSQQLARGGMDVLGRTGRVAAGIFAPAGLGGELVEGFADAGLEAGADEVDVQTDTNLVITVSSGTPMQIYVNRSF